MLVWSSLFETHIEIVDQQHKRLFEMLNHIAGEIQQGATNEKNLDAALDELVDYSMQHFVDEEKVMISHHVDHRHIALQRMEHQSFIYDVERMRAETSVDESMRERFEKLANFVASWLVYHTLRTDQHMAMQVAAIEQGASPEEAYEKSRTTALNPAINQKVLTAVLHLWTEAVERNKALEKQLKALQDENE